MNPWHLPSHRHYLIMLSMAAGWSLLIGFTCGISFEVNDDVLIQALFRGIDADPPQADLGKWFMGVGRVLTFLYHAWPSVPWYGITCVVLNAITFSNFLFLAYGVGQDRYVRIALCGSILLIGLEHFYLIQYTRIAMLLAASSTFLLVVLHRLVSATGLALWLLLILAVCIRPESAFVGGLTALIGIQLVRLGGYGWKFLQWRRSGFLVVSMLGSWMLMTITQSDDFRLDRTRVEYIQYWTAYADEPPQLSPHLTDSLIFSSMMNGMYGDRHLLNEKFLKSLGPGPDGSIATRIQATEVLEKLTITLKVLIKDHPFLSSVLFLTLFGFALCSIASRRMIVLVLIHLFVWLVLLYIATVYKMPNRVRVPIFQIYAILSLTYFGILLSWKSISESRIAVISILAGLLVGICLQLMRDIPKMQWFANRTVANTNYVMSLSISPFRELLWTYPAVNALSGLPVIKNLTIGPDRVTFVGGWTTWYVHHDRTLVQRYGVSTTVDLIRYFADKRECAIVSSPEYIDFLSNYVVTFGGTKYRFVPNHHYDFTEPTYSIPLTVFNIHTIEQSNRGAVP